MKQPKPTKARTMSYAHYLGLPSAAAATHSPVSGGSSTTSAGASPASVSRTTSSSNAARATASKQRNVKDAMPFSRLMDGFRAPATAAQPAPGKTMSFPEMRNGVATGRRVAVHVSGSAAPKIDATATAKKIIAAGERARGEA